MMLKVLSLACLLALCYSLPSPAEGEKHSDADKVIADIFGQDSAKPSQEAPAGEQKKTEKKGNEKCTIQGKQGTCVPYYLCDRPADTADASAGLIDIHIPVEPECESYVDVCCEAKYVSKAPPSAKEPVKA